MTAELYRDALVAVREALDIPHAATAGDEEIRQRIFDRRLIQVTTMLRFVLDEDDADVAWHVAYMRGEVAKFPATGYRTWEEAADERAASKEATR